MAICRRRVLWWQKLLHVTNRLYKEGIFVQISWTHCNQTNDLQCCQHHSLIRVLPEEPICFSITFASPMVYGQPCIHSILRFGR